MNEIWCRLRQSRGGINVSLSYHIYSGTECEARSIIFILVTKALSLSYHACSGAEPGKAGEASLFNLVPSQIRRGINLCW